MRSVIRYFVLIAFLLVLTSALAQAQQNPFDLHGIYVEGCSCNMVCTCALDGEMAPGCRVMGAMIISSGNYGDVDLSGVKLAFVIGGKWVRIYVQAKDLTRSVAAGELGRALLSSYGKVESVRNAQIDLSGSDGNYKLMVDGGKVVLLQTKPVLGADGKTAVTYTNYPDPLLHTIMQAKVVSGSFKEDEHGFSLKGSNSFFNQNWSASGNI